MLEIELTIHNPTGLHARPARFFVNIARQYEAAVGVLHHERKANGKSLISMLTLGVECGGQIRLQVDGPDERDALAALEQAVLAGLGERELRPVEAVSPAAGAVELAHSAPAAGIAANTIQGRAASPGITIGPAFQLRRAAVPVEEAFAGSAEEQARLERAVEQAGVDLAELRQQLLDQGLPAEAAIFEVHQELLQDPDLMAGVRQKIAQQQSAAQAWQSTIEARAGRLAALKDSVLAARAADLRDVGDRVLRLLGGVAQETGQLPGHPVIIIADDLSPSDTAAFDRKQVLGVCTAAGGPTAHSAIIARALGLPAVVNAGDGVLNIVDGTTVVLDGNGGLLTIAPAETVLAEAQTAQQQWQAAQGAARRAAGGPAVTRDGRHVEIAANIAGIDDARQAVPSGAEGVGLLRTEFLFLDRTEAPSETEQLQVLQQIVAALQGRPVTIRTLDVGGDKPLPYIDVPGEENPFLGQRGIRLLLARPDLFRDQLRAILRAAAHGPVRILLPMISDLAEFRAARALVEELRSELNSPPVELGIMVEVPSAALLADVFAREVDFFSIGTNDLVQYTLAMDRTNPALAGQSDGLHPAVLRLIAQTIRAAHAAGKRVAICGEMGADPEMIPLLVGLDVDELSVSVPAIPRVKEQVRSLHRAELKALAEQALTRATAGEVRSLLNQSGMNG